MKTKYILSLDGGGVRALASVAFLSCLEKALKVPIYEKFDFDVPIGMGEMGTVGDCWDRYIVRVREMEESLKVADDLPHPRKSFAL